MTIMRPAFRPLRRLAAAAALALCGAACSDSPAALGNDEVMVALTLAPSPVQTGAMRAFEKVDELRVSLVSPAGETLLERSYNASPSSGILRRDVRVTVPAGVTAMEARVELASRDRALFSGTAPVTVVAGTVQPVQPVLNPVAAEVRITPVPVLQLGDQATLAAAVLFATGDTAVVPVAWEVRPPAAGAVVVELVQPATLRALAEGSGTVAAHAGSVTAQQAVQVRSQVASVTVLPGAWALGAGDTVQLQAVARDARGNPLARTVAWSSLNQQVATVAASGVVTAVAPGEAPIRATVEGVASSGAVTVVPATLVSLSLALPPDAPAGHLRAFGRAERVRVVLTRENGEVALDRTWPASGGAAMQRELNVVLRSTQETLAYRIELLIGSARLFQATGSWTLARGGRTAPEPALVPVVASISVPPLPWRWATRCRCAPSPFLLRATPPWRCPFRGPTCARACSVRHSSPCCRTPGWCRTPRARGA